MWTARREDRAALLFVAVETVNRRDGAEEAVSFIVDAGGEEQSVSRSGSVFGGVAIVSEGERPQAINGHERAIGILNEADELVREAVERGDPSAAEIADENGVAELAEIASRPHDAPGRVEPVAVLEVADVLALGREELDEAESSATHGIVTRGVLLGIGDEEGSADVLHVEGSESARNALGFEGVFIEAHALESGVVDFDFGGAEIRYVEKFVAVDFAGGCAFVDGTIRGAVIGIVNDEDGVLSAVPAGDRSIFCRENEVSGCAGSDQEIRGAAIENNTCGGRQCSCR